MTRGRKKKVEEDSGSKMDQVLAELRKNSYRIEQGSKFERKDKISTGSMLLDQALNGGFILGKILEVFGPKSVGKTAMAYTLMAQTDEVTGYIDGESNYDKETAEMYGVKTENVVVSKPLYLEQGLEAVLDMVAAGVKVIVFDSIAGLAPKAELEGSMEDHNVGKKASRMGQLMRKLHLEADDTGAVVYFINQIRDSMSSYGSPITTPGGHALEFHASYRIQVTGIERIPKTEPFIGHYIKLKVEKNKFGTPGLKVDVPLIYGFGISKEWEIIDMAIEKGIIVKSGSWLKYGDVNLAQGQHNAMTFLMDNPELFDEIKNLIFDNHEKV